MATYEPYKYNITRHEGNLSDIEIEFTNVDLTNNSISLEVRDNNNSLILRKTSEDGITINPDNTSFVIQLLPEDTKEKSGVHRYEIDIMNSFGQPYITIYGVFTITPEINES